MHRPRFVQVMMNALRQMRAATDQPVLPEHELEQQATVLVHALYAQGWRLQESLLPLEQLAGYVERTER